MTSSLRIVNPNTSYNNRPTISPASPAKEHNLTNGRKVTPISSRSISFCSNFMKVVLLVCLFFQVPAALNWNCPTPQGSYLDSCDRPVGYPYQSTDPYLVDVKFCRYTVSCKKVNKPDNDKRTSEKVLSREDFACAENWENCNGFLIGRKGDARLCKDSARIKAELKEHGLFNEKDEL